MQKNKLISPFLKWVGGKRQLMPEIKELLPKKMPTYYYEPFIGGGAVLFSLQPKKAVINDANGELINVYKVIKNNVEDLIDNLMTHENKSDYFYEIRALDREDNFKNLTDIQRASRIIYLNKTCFIRSYKNPLIVNKPTLK